MVIQVSPIGQELRTLGGPRVVFAFSICSTV